MRKGMPLQTWTASSACPACLISRQSPIFYSRADQPIRKLNLIGFKPAMVLRYEGKYRDAQVHQQFPTLYRNEVAD